MRKFIRHLHGWLQEFIAPWWQQRLPSPELFTPAPIGVPYHRLERVILAEEVSQTLFDEYGGHRQGERGGEEIGWVLMGVREEDEVHVHATLPAGTARSASSTHVRFDSDTQALASRVVRQRDKRRLAIVGVVHTHPGSLRHPSEGDYYGDIRWVGHLRGGEGVFGIGTADAVPALRGESPNPAGEAQPQTNVQERGPLRFSWYALGKGDRSYRRLPVQLTSGPDLARPLHELWPTLEMHAEPLERLYRQLANVTLTRSPTPARSLREGPALALEIKLPDPGASLRVVLDRQEAVYYLCREEQVSAVDPGESDVERAVYLILAELAKKS